jgi:uncharacterized cupin superfamily protein
MPKIDLGAIPSIEGSSYPAALAGAVKGRFYQRLTQAAGLTQFGVNIVRMEPGAASSIRHWHENEDEFVIVLDGALMLIEDGGETHLVAGDCASFPAGVPNGHHLVNRSAASASFLVVGTRAATERCHYPDDDLAYSKTAAGFTFTHKDGAPY